MINNDFLEEHDDEDDDDNISDVENESSSMVFRNFEYNIAVTIQSFFVFQITRKQRSRTYFTLQNEMEFTHCHDRPICVLVATPKNGIDIEIDCEDNWHELNDINLFSTISRSIS